jgi:hypothetical protein
MKPHQGTKYSKLLDPNEIQEVLMYEDSNEEIEDRDEGKELRI